MAHVSCSATLHRVEDHVPGAVSERYFAITAVHCIREKNFPGYDPNLVISWSPIVKVLSEQKEFQTGRVFAHPEYMSNFFYLYDRDPPNEVSKIGVGLHDIAVIEVFMDYEPWRDHLDKLELFEKVSSLSSFIAAGYGVGMVGGHARWLDGVKIRNRWDTESFTYSIFNSFAPILTKGQALLVTAREFSNAKYGDSGGPLFSEDGKSLVGIASFILGDPSWSVSYVSTYAYKDFLQTVIKQLVDDPVSAFANNFQPGSQ